MTEVNGDNGKYELSSSRSDAFEKGLFLQNIIKADEQAQHLGATIERVKYQSAQLGKKVADFFTAESAAPFCAPYRELSDCDEKIPASLTLPGATKASGETESAVAHLANRFQGLDDVAEVTGKALQDTALPVGLWLQKQEDALKTVTGQVSEFGGAEIALKNFAGVSDAVNGLLAKTHPTAGQAALPKETIAATALQATKQASTSPTNSFATTQAPAETTSAQAVALNEPPPLVGANPVGSSVINMPALPALPGGGAESLNEKTSAKDFMTHGASALAKDIGGAIGGKLSELNENKAGGNPLEKLSASALGNTGTDNITRSTPAGAPETLPHSAMKEPPLPSLAPPAPITIGGGGGNGLSPAGETAGILHNTHKPFDSPYKIPETIKAANATEKNAAHQNNPARALQQLAPAANAALQEFEKLKPTVQNINGKAKNQHSTIPGLEAPRLTAPHLPAHNNAGAGMHSAKQPHGLAQNGLPHTPSHVPASIRWGGTLAPKGAPAPGKHDAALKNNTNKTGGQSGNAMNVAVSKMLHQITAQTKSTKERSQADIAAVVAKVLRGAAGHSDLH